MSDKESELIITTAKELLLKALEKPSYPINARAKEVCIDLGDQFKVLVAKVSEALAAISVAAS